MDAVSRTTRRIAVTLALAVFLVFAGGAMVKGAPAEIHGCVHGPCATTQPSVPFCIAHCLDAAQADHGTATATATAGTLLLVAFGAAAAPFLRVRPQFHRLFSVPRDVFPPLRAFQTIALRE